MKLHVEWSSQRTKRLDFGSCYDTYKLRRTHRRAVVAVVVAVAVAAMVMAVVAAVAVVTAAAAPHPSHSYTAIYHSIPYTTWQY